MGEWGPQPRRAAAPGRGRGAIPTHFSLICAAREDMVCVCVCVVGGGVFVTAGNYVLLKLLKMLEKPVPACSICNLSSFLPLCWDLVSSNKAGNTWEQRRISMRAILALISSAVIVFPSQYHIFPTSGSQFFLLCGSIFPGSSQTKCFSC